MGYRETYQEALDIELSDSAHIHHISFDKTDNRIANLVAIPKSLHGRFHYYFNRIRETLARYIERMDFYGSSGDVETVIKDIKTFEEIKASLAWWIEVRNSLTGAYVPFFSLKNVDISEVYAKVNKHE